MAGASHPVVSPPNGCPEYGMYIARALATEGGHLFIGHNGFTLWYGWGCRLYGYDQDVARAECVRAGLPVIDARAVPFARLWDLVAAGPMIAVGEPPGAPPWGALSYAPLVAVARAYRAAGAEVLNLPGAEEPEEEEEG